MNKRIRKKKIKKLAIEIYNSNHVWCSPDVAIALAINYMFPKPKNNKPIENWNGLLIKDLSNEPNLLSMPDMNERNELLNGKWGEWDKL